MAAAVSTQWQPATIVVTHVAGGATMRRTTLSWITCIAIVSALLTGCSKSPDTTDTTSEEPDTPPVGRLSGNVAPEHYRLELRIDPREDTFSGRVTIDVTVNEATDRIYLHGKRLEISSAHVVDGEDNQIAASWEQVDDTGVAKLSLDRPVSAGSAAIHLVYSVAFNAPTDAIFKVDRDGESYAASQFQAISAREAFPGFDEPAFKVPFDIVLETRAEDVAVTTTPEESVEPLEGGFVRRTFMTTRPMPTYLLAFAVGPYDVVDYGMLAPNAIRDRELPLRAIVPKGQAGRAEYALKHTQGLLTILEEYFGTPYPYRKLDLIAMPTGFGGAMENIGAITYDPYILLMDDASPLDQRRSYTYIHAHELAHMWFGNLVTPEWWDDLWLNESFASWMMYKAAAEYWPEGEFDREVTGDALSAMVGDSLAASRQIREPIDHSRDIESAFDSITYQKGGGVLAMLERYVGEDDFRDGIRLHMSRHQDATATAEDFIASIAEGSDRTEIEGAFKSFIGQPGVPLLTARLVCEPDQSPRLHVRQQRYAPLGSTIDADGSRWDVPMCFKYQADGETHSNCSLLSDKEQQFELSAASCPEWVHLNADGAGYYRFALDEAGWLALIEDARELSAGEALVLADSLDAALRADAVSADTFIKGMAALLEHDAWDVVVRVTDTLSVLDSAVEFDRLGPVWEGYQALVKPVYESIPDSDDSASALLRSNLLRFLIVIARDQEMRAPLAEKAVSRIGLNGEPDESAVAVDELETVLSIGVQDVGEPFFDLLLEQAIATEDPGFRAAATGALARVEEPALVEKLQGAILSGDLSGTDAIGILYRQMVRSATQQATFNWMKANPDEFMALFPESFRAQYVPTFGYSLCGKDSADEWQAFVESHADVLPGYERSLAQATENARLCGGLREASQDEIIEALVNVRGT